MAKRLRDFGTVTGRTSDSPTFTTPALGTPASGVMTNMTGAVEASLVDDAITLAKMVAGTDGNIISYDASGNPVAIATGSDGQVLHSAGAGAQPAFETLASSFTGFAGLSFNASAGPCDGNNIALSASTNYVGLVAAIYGSIGSTVIHPYDIAVDGTGTVTLTKRQNHSPHLVFVASGSNVFARSGHDVFDQPWGFIWKASV